MIIENIRTVFDEMELVWLNAVNYRIPIFEWELVKYLPHANHYPNQLNKNKNKNKNKN